MKLLICGSRSITSPDAVANAITEFGLTPDLVISGGARGVDSSAEVWAKRNGVPCEVIKPDWETHGKSAGVKRNIVMVDKCDAVLAIWDGDSRGTKFTIDYGTKSGKEVFVTYASRTADPETNSPEANT